MSYCNEENKQNKDESMTEECMYMQLRLLSRVKIVAGRGLHICIYVEGLVQESNHTVRGQ